ncbi:MAG: RHS repeat domain-containing protein [Caldilineaceae bacterium]
MTRTDPLGNTWTWTYDGAGRMKTETDPLNHTTTYSYDLFGRRTMTQDHRVIRRNTSMIWLVVYWPRMMN